ncbi:MAG: OmpA family protein [Bacteroidota bacterium]
MNVTTLTAANRNCLFSFQNQKRLRLLPPIQGQYWLLFFSFFFLSATALQGQASEDVPDRFHALSARILAIDNETLNDELMDLSTTFGLELGYRRQFNRLLALAVPLKMGVLDTDESRNVNFVSIDFLAHLYPLGVNNKVSPYLLAGYGVTAEGVENSNHQVPVGLGINFSLGENSFLSLQGEARFNDEVKRDNIQLGIGYVYRLHKVDNDADGIVNKEDRCPEIAGPAATGGCPDTDGDGLADLDDRCPEIAGTLPNEGCPDTDGDGIIDDKDRCPELAGPAEGSGCPDSDADGKYDHEDECPEVYGEDSNGCPLPDTDGDGIPDGRDDCPTKAGPADHYGCPDTDGDGKYDNEDACPERAANTPDGCPLPDRDNDGVPNRDDRCPDEAGPASNRGCPEVEAAVVELLEFATQAVQFETGSARLKTESFFVLDEIAEIMQRYPNYSLLIAGHTDDVGDENNNQVLSEERARACRDYLRTKGILNDRMSYLGYGEAQPRTTNDTAAGRRLNRRVEFDLQVL